jgi:hypothetical protein
VTLNLLAIPLCVFLIVKFGKRLIYSDFPPFDQAK